MKKTNVESLERGDELLLEGNSYPFNVMDVVKGKKRTRVYGWHDDHEGIKMFDCENGVKFLIYNPNES